MYILVIFNGFGGMKQPREDLVFIQFVFNKIVLEKLALQASYFLSFSLLFPFSQTAFEDDFSQDEWLKSLPPLSKGALAKEPMANQGFSMF